MRKNYLIFAILTCIVFPATLMAQKKVAVEDVKYRRSSLHTILIESEKFPMKDTVISAYNSAPFPDKYNDHTIGAKSFDPNLYPLTEESIAAMKAQEEKEAQNNGTEENGSKEKKGNNKISARNYTIREYFRKEKIANQLVAKWFNRQEDGSFNMDLIAERGFYDATAMQASIAKNSERGLSSLADAGEELIGNTFVVVNELNFVSNEYAAAAAREIAKAAARQIPNPIAQNIALKAADVAYNKAKEGYSVWTTSYLYQLDWNDSVTAVFYTELWMDSLNIDTVKKATFDSTDLFQLKYIGEEKATSLVTFSLKEKRSEEKIVEIATIRNIDAVYAKLQKKYDVFKTKTPLLTGDPITAKIGMKEGLEGGERFEVLEQIIDPLTERTKYKKVGVITVNKKKIWDNRYNAGEDPDSKTSDLEATTFDGGKNYYPGMLIRQIK